MSLYENWMKKAFTPKGQSVDAVWDIYLPLEQKIYEYILGEKVQDMEYKISEIAVHSFQAAYSVYEFFQRY